jgi:hypothetical protein
MMGVIIAMESDSGGRANAVVFVRATRLLDAADGESGVALYHRINGRANSHWNRLLAATSITAGKDEVPARSKPTQVPTQRSSVPLDMTISVAFGLEPRAAPTSGQPAAIGAAEAFPATTSVTVASVTEIATATSRPDGSEPVTHPTPRINFVEDAVAAV